MYQTGDGSWSTYHREHGESYHAQQGAALETRDLFIKSSGFLKRIEDARPLYVLDVGLGLGYNALMTLKTWSDFGQGPLSLVSLEQDLWCQTQEARFWEKDFSELSSFRDGLSEPGAYQYLHKEDLSWELHWGPAQETIKSLRYTWDFIWQDPFSPSKGLDLWSVSWFSDLRKQAHKDTVLVTYSVAGQIKRNLKEAGWVWEEIPGTTKTSWLKAHPGGDGET